MDSEELDIETENDLDTKYKRMTKEGKNYKVWVESLEKRPEEEELKAERYARHLKKV